MVDTQKTRQPVAISELIKRLFFYTCQLLTGKYILNKVYRSMFMQNFYVIDLLQYDNLLTTQAV